MLLFAVRPLIKGLRQMATKVDERDELAILLEQRNDSQPAKPIDQETLNRQIGYVQRLVEEKPDRAVLALREMLEAPDAGTTENESEPS